MATVSVSVPDELKAEMLEHDEINWSAVARKAFEVRIHQIQTIKRLAAKSKLTQKDVDEFTDMVSTKASKRFLELK